MPPSAEELETLSRRVQTAVETGSDSAERAYWNARRDSEGELARLALATLDRFTYRYAEAEEGYENVGATNEATRAYALLGMAMLRLQQARYADAEPILRRVVLATPGATAARAQALMYLATVVARTVSIDSSLATYEAAERAVPPGDDWLATLVRCNALVARVRKADPTAGALARPLSQDAIRAGNRRAAAACLAALAQDQERRTAFDSAYTTFTEVAELQRATRNLAALAVTRQWLGFVATSNGSYYAARPALDEAVTLGRRTGTLAASAWAEISLANIALTFGDLTSAGRYARSAAATFAKTGDRSGLVLARQHQGDVALLNRAFPAARTAFEHVIGEAPSVFPSLAVHARGRLAAVAMFEGDWPAAERELDAALADATRLNMPEWRVQDAYARATLALVRGQLDETIARFGEFATFVAWNGTERVDVQTRLAEAHMRAGRIADGEAHLLRAGELIDHTRRGLLWRDLQAAVLQKRTLDWDRDLGFATALAGLAAAGRVSAAFRIAEQRRAFFLFEGLVRRNVLAGRSDSAAYAARLVDDGAARAVLPESTAVLSFITGRGREPTTVFVLTRERSVVSIVAPVDDHVDDLDRFAGLVAAGEVPLDLGRRLGDVLLRAPLAQLPANVRHLVLVPDGPLHRLPFDALVLGDGRLLMERYVLSRAPSVAVASAWWSAPPRAPRPRLMSFGDPTGVRFTEGTADSIPPRLPVAAREARAVARFAESAIVFTGADARESRIRRASLHDVGVLHFATHADVEEWSLMRSALLLAPGDNEDGRLTTQELLGLELAANLVVLSACRSGSGAVIAGEGLHGLTIPLLEAGAASVVATLWQVGDRSVAPMIERFYRELATGVGVGEALHRAKQRAREQGVSPAIWAAFVLTGDARATTDLRTPAPNVAGYGIAVLLLAIAAGYWLTLTLRRRNAERRSVPSASSPATHQR